MAAYKRNRTAWKPTTKKPRARRGAATPMKGQVGAFTRQPRPASVTAGAQAQVGAIRPTTQQPGSTVQPAARPAASPYDPQYYQQIGGAQRDYQLGMGQLAVQETDLYRTYGFDNPATPNIDESKLDPYNRAKMLERAYQQGQRGTGTSMAAQGQLYSGALQRGLDEGTFQYQRGYGDLSSDLSRQAADIGFERTAAANAFADAVATYGWEAVSRALERRPADPGPAGSSAPTATAARPAQPPPRYKHQRRQDIGRQRQQTATARARRRRRRRKRNR